MTDMLDTAEGFASLLKQKARTQGSDLFCRFEGRPTTFAEIDRLSDAFACELRRRKIARGERVAVMLRNSPAAIAVIFGLAKAGVVWIPVNARQQGPGLRYILEHCEPSLIVVESDLLPAVENCGAALPDRLVHDPAGNAGALETALRNPCLFEEEAPGPHDGFAIMYTSGTTGPPKGVLVSHAMLRFAAEAVRRVSGIGDGDVMFVWEPFFHIGGAQLLVLPFLTRVTLGMVGTFSGSRFWSQVRAEGATHIHYLGGVLQTLLKQPPDAHDRQHKVRVAWGGGCPVDIWQTFSERFGVEIRECYGMTETSSIATFNASGVVGSVGKAAPWFDVVVMDESGAPCAPQTQGMIGVREKVKGALLTGYFRSKLTRQDLFRGDYFVTGDLGVVDISGNLFFRGRATDGARVKGENVSAWDVESVAEQHEAVEAAAMIGVAAEIGEQDIKLFVQPKAGHRIDPGELSAWLMQRLAPYQVPRYISVVPQFERTPSERIMKHRLSKATDDSWDRLSAKVNA